MSLDYNYTDCFCVYYFAAMTVIPLEYSIVKTYAIIPIKSHLFSKHFTQKNLVRLLRSEKVVCSKYLSKLQLVTACKFINLFRCLLNQGELFYTSETKLKSNKAYLKVGDAVMTRSGSIHQVVILKVVPNLATNGPLASF